MCGIVGFISSEGKSYASTRTKFFRDALVMDTLRGADSTGVYTVNSDGQTYWYKHVIPGFDFVREKDWHSLLVPEIEDAAFCVGHNRAATVGKVTTDNAHPFVEENVILVHNGTLTTTRDLPYQNNAITVDSNLIAHNLSMSEPEDAVSILEKLDGAYSLVWFDKRTKKLYMCRNEERPLHVATARFHKTLYFASEGAMLNAAMARNKMTVESIYSLKVGELLSFDIGELAPEARGFQPLEGWRGYYKHQSAGPYATEVWTLKGNKAEAINRRMYDSYGPKGPGRNLLKADSAKVYIDMETKDIPEPHEAMLGWMDVDTTDVMEFIPERYYTTKGGMVNVEGQVRLLAWEMTTGGIVHNVAKSVISTEMDHKWLVRAVGIKWDRDAEGYKRFMNGDKNAHQADKPVLILRPTLNGLSYRSPSDNPLVLVDEDDEVETYLGPAGAYLDKATWEKITDDGCCMCARPVYPAEHEEIKWVGEHRNQPLCPDCNRETDILFQRDRIA